MVFNPQTRVCTWPWDLAVKDRCNIVPPPQEDNDIDASGDRDEYSSDNIVFKPDIEQYEGKEDLCPSDYTGLTLYPYNCKKFVNCWKGKM